jgi:hypothetical protein
VLYSATPDALVFVKTEHQLGMVIGDAFQSRELALLGIRAFQSQAYLDIDTFILRFSDKIDFPVIQFSNGYAITALEKFQIYNILQYAVDIAIMVTQKTMA